MMNFVAWYLIQYELIEYWLNPMDKYIIKFIISSLAVMLFVSYWTAVLRQRPKIPMPTDPELLKQQCYKCQAYY